MMPFFISGDWPFFFAEQIKPLPWTPSAYWIWANFGENALARLWLDYPFRLIVKLFSTMGLSWVIMEKLFLVVIALCAAWSAYRLSGRFFKEKWMRLVSSLMYTGNTYFFLVLGGGQFGVAAAYAFFPFALLMWIQLLKSPSFRKVIGTGVAFGLLVAFDLRIAYLCILAFALYSTLAPRAFLSCIKYIAASLAVAASLHLYWLLPAAVAGSLPLPQSATGAGSLSFFSVADLSHVLSLLHPNWPENLFGRVYFQQPEFLILPILAFASLLFCGQGTINNKQNNRLLFTAYCPFFALLSLVGIFLAKGVNPPGGQVYEFFFRYVPGFFMFRDPTKFYIFIALGYSILIPVTLDSIVRFGFIRRNLVIGIFVLFELFLFRDVFLSKTTHSFQFQPIPKEYERFQQVLRADTRFSRVLWLPGLPHFAYFDDTHPFVDAQHALGVSSPSAIIASLQEPVAQEILAEKNIGYLVVPTDEGRRMFLNDYVYDESQRKLIIDGLKISSFMKMGDFSDIAVFRNPYSRDLFTGTGGMPILWQSISANRYDIVVPGATRFLTMHLSFDPGWRLRVGSADFAPVTTAEGWIRFEIPERINKGTVYFAPDRWARMGAIISGILLVLYCVRLSKRTVWKS